MLAIIGYAVRFPGGADSPDALWDLLVEGRDAIVPIPLDRLPQRYRHSSPDVPGRTASVQAGMLGDIAGFDAAYFGISPREARLMDPHQRLLLELSVEALESSGVPAASLAGRPVAVFTAMAGAQYSAQISDREMDVQTGVGVDASIGANRISYVLDLAGPSVTINTACSSALTAFHLGCQSIRSGEAEMAIVCAANLLIDPRFHLMLSKAMLLSPDARCRSFDARGNGYVRAEGAAVMIVKRLERALADGDAVRALVRATAANADGRTDGISLPSGDAQERLLREVYARAEVAAGDVTYVEAHGTGTRVGDPIECGAIGRVLGTAHSPDKPLLIGSIKSNIGHMETAAGFGGLAKALLSLEHGALPPSLHFETPHPDIDFAGQNLRVVTAMTPIPPEDAGVIGVSSFGFGGANAHVVLQRPASRAVATPPPEALALPVTARSAEALDAAVAQMAAFVARRPDLDAADIAYTALRRRDLHPHRAVVVASDRAGLLTGLQALTTGAESGGVARGLAGKAGRTAFVFTGNGPQWHAMGRELLVDCPAFRERFAEVDACFQARAGFSLLAELHRDEQASRIAQTEVAQPLLFALQLALVAALAKLGVTPHAVLGHSVGEVAAACVAGALDLPAAVRVIHERSRWQETTAGAGAMAAIGLSAADAQAWLDQRAMDVVVAAANGPASATLAGAAASLDRLQQQADEAGVFFRRLRLDYAFHSPAMDPIRAPLLDALHGLAPHAEAVPFISSVTGGRLGGDALDADYWWRNVRDPVRFHDAVRALIGAGHDAFIEIGPHPALSAYVSEALAAERRSGRVFETLRRRSPEGLALHTLAARCLATGVTMDHAQLSPAGKVVALPSYPWRRERHWAAGVLAEGDERHPLLGAPLSGGVAHWENDVSVRSHSFLADHRFAGDALFPTTGYIELARAAAQELFGGAGAEIHDLDIHEMLTLPGERAVRIGVAVQADGGFAVRSRLADEPAHPWTLHASGRIAPLDADAGTHLHLGSQSDGLDGEAFYAGLDPRKVSYGPQFRVLRRLYKTGTEVGLGDWTVGDLGAPQWLAERLGARHGYGWHPSVIDAALQLPLVDFAVAGGEGAFLPSGLRRVRVMHSGEGARRVAMRVVRLVHNLIEAEMLVLAGDGRVLARIDGYQARRAGGSREAWPQGMLHRHDWRLLHGRQELPVLAPAAVLTPAAPSAAGLDRAAWTERVHPALDRLCGALAADALHALSPDGGGAPDLGALAEAGEIDEAMLPYGRRLQAIAANYSPNAAIAAWREAFAAAPEAFLELELVWTVGTALADVLRGVVDPQDLLQTGPAGALLGRATEGGVLAASARSAMAAAASALSAAWPADRPLRVLELGASRSAVTAAVLASLTRAALAEYVLSDPDAALLEAMRLRFDRPGLVVAVIDPTLASDLASLAGPFDVIIGNDMLQQAADLLATLRDLRSLLSPNGLLLLDLRYAGAFSDLVFGNQRGMRRIPGEAWPALLEQAGFADAAQRPLRPHGLGAIAAARNPAAMRGEGAAPSGIGSSFLIAAPGSRAQQADALAAGLAARGHAVQRARYAADNSQAAWQEALRQGPDEVLFLTPAPEADGGIPAELCAPLLRLAPAMLAVAAPPRLTLVTTNGFAAPARTEPPDPTQALFWGYVRTLGNEHPTLRCRRIDLHGEAEVRLAALLTADAAPGEDELLLTPDAVYVHRLQILDSVADAEKLDPAPPGYALSVAAQGSLQNLAWHRAAPRPPEAHEVQIAVRASGLNFKDVLLVMGMLPPELLKAGPVGPAIGLECAGVVTAVGSAVGAWEVGDRVAAFAPGCFASSLTVDAGWVARLPDALSFEDGATMPTVFATAWYALHHLARLQPGETVLVHGGAGGVGLAAIQIAHRVGATVIATAGSAAKRDLLRRIGVAHALDSRTLAFADEARRLTGGAGVDVALNALSGEAMLATLGALRPFGRFLEIGKRDLIDNRKVGLRGFIDNVSYHAIDLDQLFTHRPDMLTSLLREVMEQAESGQLRPLPRELYPPTRVIEAFRHMQASRHVGKLVVSYESAQPPAVRIRPAVGSLRLADGGAILVTGGTRGFGLAVAGWLASRGAPRLVLAGRTGALSEEGEAAVAAMRAAGTRVEVKGVDVGRADEVRRLLSDIAALDLPLTGVFHAAVDYRDGMASSLTPEDMERVIAPKARGAWLLDQLTRQAPLRHFVLFSSIAATVGSEGQAAYSAANLYLDALVARRRSEGLCGLAINWGAIGDAGEVARNQALRERMVSGGGLDLLPVADGLAALEEAMLSEVQEIGIGGLPIRAIRDWHGAGPTGRLEPVLAAFRRAAGERTGPGRPGADWANAATDDERLAGFKALVVGIVRENLGYGSRSIDGGLTLGDLGADSLIALQLVRTLERELGIRFANLRLLQTRSLDDLVMMLFEQCRSSGPGASH
jgi:acyl transferase domain-containing protein/NADPH:quinone reductase-like Zn-dependent oxidoreductase/NAD(P)-dependent dehydrogenase (short-subunit alcohol dehydrogenase family)/acyl carrier protein